MLMHLERMKASAAELGLSFDRHKARNQLHALCFVLEKPSRVRLLASRSGAIALEAHDMPDTWPDPAQCIVLPLPVDPGDWRLRHKTSDRDFYDHARRESGAFETLFTLPDGSLSEGSFTNIFVARGDRLATPPVNHALPGVLRAELGRMEAEAALIEQTQLCAVMVMVEPAETDPEGHRRSLDHRLTVAVQGNAEAFLFSK